jgi:Ca2+-binding EF-hand superfamily protein
MKKILKANNPHMTAKQDQQADHTIRDLYNFIDIDKNNFVDYKELSAALIVLCKASLESKLTYGIKVFSRSVENKVKYTELKNLLHFIYKLCLETKNEILLDYDMDKLAKEVSDYAFEYSN